MLIGFAGIPGAGKSSLRAAVLDRLAEAGVEVVLPTELNGGSKVCTAWRHRRLLWQAGRVLAASSRRPADKWAALRFLLVSLHRDRAARARPGEEWCVLDEGLVQRAFLLLVDADQVRADLVDRYLELAPLPDAVVRVDVPAAVAIERIEARATRGLPTRLADLGRTEVRDRLTEGAAMLDRVGHLPPDRVPTIIDVDGRRPIDELADEVADRLLALRPEPRTH